jgi:hypothetical protein
LVGDLSLLPPWYHQQRKYHGHTLPGNRKILCYLDGIKKQKQYLVCFVIEHKDYTVL